MDETAREQLAKRLSAMSLKDARTEMRVIDPDAILKYYRNSIWGECHTLFVLPNAGLSIALVEKDKVETMDAQSGGAPRGLNKESVEYQYIEARVTPLDRPATKRGGSGPSPRLHMQRQRDLAQAQVRDDS